MRHLITNVFLAFIWMALTMDFTTVSFFFGFVVSFLILWFLNRKNGKVKYFFRPLTALKFLSIFLKEVVKGSLKIGWDIITPRYYMTPAIIAFPLDCKTDIEITLLANAITLTPGTTSVAVSDDKSILYVYCTYSSGNLEKDIADIKNGLEKSLLEVLR